MPTISKILLMMRAWLLRDMGWPGRVPGKRRKSVSPGIGRGSLLRRNWQHSQANSARTGQHSGSRLRMNAFHAGLFFRVLPAPGGCITAMEGHCEGPAGRQRVGRQRACTNNSKGQVCKLPSVPHNTLTCRLLQQVCQVANMRLS